MKIGDIVYKKNSPNDCGIVIKASLPPSRPDRNADKRAVIVWRDGRISGSNKEKYLMVILEA